MPLEHLQLLPILQADDEIREDRLLHRHRRLRLLGDVGRLSRAGERRMHDADQLRQRCRRDLVVSHMRSHDPGRQLKQLTLFGVLAHRHPFAGDAWAAIVSGARQQR